jgi:glutamine synthetase
VTKPFCYHIHQFEELRPVLLDVVEYGQALGLDMSYGDHEDAPGQLELNFRFDRPLRTADNITTYRQVCTAVARKHDLLACFMPKPFTGVSANGHHHHFTLMDDNGVNVFHDPDGPAQLSQFARHFLGGMLEHFPALMCVGNPTVNSNCRMWDTGFWAPIYKNWGWQNRTTTVRVASGGRFEYRGVDSSCNPYLTVATLLRAGLDGVRRELDPGPPQQAIPMTCSSRAWRSRRCPTAWARRWRRWPRTRWSRARCPGASTRCFTTTSATSGSATSPP